MKAKLEYWAGIISIWFIYICSTHWAINEWSGYFEFEPISFWQSVSIFVLLFIFIIVPKNLIKS